LGAKPLFCVHVRKALEENFFPLLSTQHYFSA